ncbi:hypothetical protein B0H14DRAFT_2370656 [Mycena olivaceomarginata]|nr:hypothetical protein B0H14DRAFT_2370656 [Mycena olivaceomarginata]
MEAFVRTFQIQLADAGSSPTFSDISAGSSVFSGNKPLFSTVADPRSFLADSSGSKFSLSWDHWAGFQAWLENEEHCHCIELHHVQTTKGMPQFEKKLCYVCSWHGTGDVKVYEKRFPEQGSKASTKTDQMRLCSHCQAIPGDTPATRLVQECA